ncbi:acyltransferase family protein [Novosphingobium terrae]|uniref:acyltransferase family protein n=1 Tax=Novosphingobium terrae TaxID=2726189 RepID=UPI0019801179|nr:acyltransferase [Novosphingobium terrae]
MPEGKTETPQATRLPGLDALRGIAAIGIVIFHVPDILGNRLIANRFYLFVDLFFLLSGFVITLSAEPRLAQGLSLQSFMRARLRRLWPMLAFGIALHALAFIGQNGILHIIPLMILGLLLVPVLTAGGLAYPINGPQWSLVWELVANVAHAAGLRHLSDRALLLVAALAGLGALAAAHHAGCACSGPNVTNWWLGGARMAWAYTIGVWMARQWRKAPRRPLVD